MNSRYSWSIKLACGGALVLILLASYPFLCGAQVVTRTLSGTKTDAIVGFSFQLEVEGRLTAAFSTCFGIGSNHELIQQKTVDKSGRSLILKVPGLLQWHDITLTRNLTSDTRVSAWRQEVVDGKTADAKRRGVLTMSSADGKPVAIWELTNVWPSALIAGSKTGPDGVVEELTITYDGMVRRQ